MKFTRCGLDIAEVFAVHGVKGARAQQARPFVAIKSEEQQAVLTVHRARTLAVANRTAQVNQTRGLLGEFGLVLSEAEDAQLNSITVDLMTA
jgi:transposase